MPSPSAAGFSIFSLSDIRPSHNLAPASLGPSLRRLVRNEPPLDDIEFSCHVAVWRLVTRLTIDKKLPRPALLPIATISDRHDGLTNILAQFHPPKRS